MTDAEQARYYFRYDPDTGVVVRQITVSSRARKGAELCSLSSQGYYVVRFQGKLVLVHRLIWLMQTGDWPAYEIDHINRVKTDNRWCNLRDVTCTINLQNRPIAESGCYWAERDRVWVASTQSFGKKKHIGQSKDKAIAEAMYRNYIAVNHPERLK